MDKFVSISLAAQALGVSTSTLRRWEASGRLLPCEQKEVSAGMTCLPCDLKLAAVLRRCVRLSPMPGCPVMIKRRTWSGESEYLNCTARVMDGRST